MVITVAHTKGGVGKSTLAWNLAYSFLELNKRVLIVDLDFQQTLYFTNAISEDDSMRVVQPQSVKELMELLLKDESADIYIVDVGGFDSDINRTAMEFAHKVIVPVSDSLTEVLGLETFKGILDTLILDAEINIVLNNIHPLTKNFNVIREAVGDKYKLLNTVIRCRRIYKTCMGLGRSVFDYREGIATKEIRGLRDELI